MEGQLNPLLDCLCLFDGYLIPATYQQQNLIIDWVLTMFLTSGRWFFKTMQGDDNLVVKYYYSVVAFYYKRGEMDEVSLFF